MKYKIPPEQILCNFLRANVTDINSSRSTAFIFPDYPRIKNIGDTDFPRVGITVLSNPAEYLGMFLTGMPGYFKLSGPKVEEWVAILGFKNVVCPEKWVDVLGLCYKK